MDEKDVDWRLIRLSRENAQGAQYASNNIVTSRYTVLTFLPKFFYEQFRRKSNLFFLCLIILQLSLEVPTNPSAYIIAFTVVIVVSGIKQGYEDWGRHKADDKVNSRKAHVFDRTGSLVPKKAKKIRVGEIVRLEENDPVPCDLLLISCLSASGEPLPRCEITTANLDGEPNRKLRFCPSGLPDLSQEGLLMDSLEKEPIVLEYDQPGPDLYKLNGLLTSCSSENPVPLSMDNVLLRGTTVKSPGLIYGCVIYTGPDSRLSLNSTAMKRNKFSTVDHATNRLVYIMFFLLLILCGISLGLFFWMRSTVEFTEAWYLPPEDSSVTWLGVTTFFLFLVFLSYLIPISLSVSIEIQKFGCSYFFAWDEEMRCGRTGAMPLCNTSDLNEELGQIEYLLTDKTGTLTENNLKFATCSVNGVRYEAGPQGDSLVPVDGKGDEGKEAEFFEALALCHTAQVVLNSAGDSQYQSSSADEEVLLEAARDLAGVTFLGEEKEVMSLKVGGRRQEYTRHLTLEFDSERKCMSVIVEDTEGKVFVLTKGAESTILPKSEAKSSADLLDTCLLHVNEFAKKGLRTLVVSKKEISRDELIGIQTQVEALRRRPKELQAYYSDLETQLRLLGVTGVEDELQSSVPETLEALKEAGIRIWMLTGDKMETAVNVGISSRLSPLPDLRDQNGNPRTWTPCITECTEPGELSRRLAEIKDRLGPTLETTLVIDGASFAVGFETCLELLSEVAMSSSQVIFCRMAPLQKAQVVRLIKCSKAGRAARTCAVGDGGNDVAMIQEAHLGIGVMGREGRQASRAADFAVPGFQYLRKAILVHGYWYYYRLATLVAYFFYRGLLFVLPQFLYGFDSGFSGQTVYHSSYMMCYSLIFSALPVVICGLSEQPKSAAVLLQFPALYRDQRGNALMGWKPAAWWGGLLLWHTALIFYFPRLVWDRESEVMDWGFFSHFLSGVVVAVTDLKIATGSTYFTWFTMFGQAWSYGTMLVFYSISSEVMKSQSGGFLKFAYFPLVSNPEFWLVTLLISVLASLPDFVMGGIRRLRFLQERSRMKAENRLGS